MCCVSSLAIVDDCCFCGPILLQTVKDTRHWVSTLRYIKEYCSRLEVRYTVISAEQEMEFVRRALEDDADSTGVS